MPIAVLYNVHSFCLHLQLPPFYIKTNLRENPFFAVEWAIGGEKCSYNVKICTKNITNQIENKGAREQGDKLTRKRVNKLMGAAIFSPLLVDKVTSNKVTSLHGVSHLFTIISWQGNKITSLHGVCHLFTIISWQGNKITSLHGVSHLFTFSPFHLLQAFHLFTLPSFPLDGWFPFWNRQRQEEIAYFRCLTKQNNPNIPFELNNTMLLLMQEERACSTHYKSRQHIR